MNEQATQAAQCIRLAMANLREAIATLEDMRSAEPNAVKLAQEARTACDRALRQAGVAMWSVNDLT